jgi:hypothetical protein
VGVALAEAGVLGRVEASVHARQDREATRGRQRQAALLAEVGRVRLVRCSYFVFDGHAVSNQSVELQIIPIVDRFRLILGASAFWEDPWVRHLGVLAGTDMFGSPAKSG